MFKCEKCEKCEKCDFEGINRNKLWYQKEIKLTKGSEIIIVKRKEDKFECKCGKSSKVPRTMYRHIECFWLDFE
jgi:hypothetical protein